MNPKFRYIAIEGPVGVGKTALVKLLAEHFSAEGSEARTVYDTVDNPFLKAFYDEEQGSAFLTQLFFLLSRYHQQQKLRQQTLFSNITVCDYLFDKDRIFAYTNLTDNELLVYERLYKMLSENITAPDLVMYLQAETPVLMKRIRDRGLDYERNISKNYLERLNDAYINYFFNYNKSPLLVVRTSEIDFVHKKEDFENLVKQIETFERGTRYYIPAGSGRGG